MISIKNVSYKYQNANNSSLKNINLDIKEGEFILLLGKSGSGKTTITRLINGLIEEYYQGELTGEVIVDNKHTSEIYVSELSRTVGSVFQDPSSQFFTTDTDSELVFALENQGVSKDIILKRYDHVKKELKLDKLLNRSIFQLSAGEKQLIAIGSVIASEPKVLVFDEPSANLDLVTTKNISNILKTLKEKGYTIIIAEHKIDYLKELVDRAILFSDGKIVLEMNNQELNKLTNIEANRLSLRSLDYSKIELNNKTNIKETNDLVLNNINYQYNKDKVIFNNLNITFNKGEIVGLVGKNGQGKSTLLEIICGLRKITKGNILFNNHKANTKILNKKSYLVMQTSEYQLFSDSVINEFTLDSKIEHLNNDKLNNILEQLNLIHLKNRHPLTLSGGEKQRLAIALAYYKQAEIICFDEPTSGLDYNNMKIVSKLLKDLANSGKIIIVVTHDYEFLIDACDKVMHLKNNDQVTNIIVNSKNKETIRKTLNKEIISMKENKKTNNGMQLLFKFIKPCIKKEILAIIFATVSVFGAIIPYYATYEIFKLFFNNNLTKQEITYWIMIAIVGFVIKGVAHSISTCLAHISAYTILENIRLHVADKLMKAPLGTVQKQNIGKIKSLIVDHVEKLELPLAHVIPEGFAAFVLPLFVFIYMFSIDYRLALISLITIPIGLASFVSCLADYNKNYQNHMKANDTMNSSIVEYIEGIEVIKAFNQTSTSYKKFSKAINHFFDTTLDWFNATYKAMSFMKVMMPTTVLGVLPLGLYLYITENLDPTIIVVSIMLSMGVVSSLMKFSLFINDLSSINYALNQVADLIDTSELNEGTKDNEITHYNLSFNSVFFSYNTNELVIDNLSYDFKDQKYYALVGPSGSGKSTIAKLISRYYDPTNGTITIGGVDIKDISLAKLSKLISYVTQDNYLFNTSIYENIKMGNPNATKEEVYNACKKASCHEFILSLENGYQTNAGEAGTKLSGGEKQRIALARAILKDAPIIVLDEATAFTDPENEAIIQESISQLTKNKLLIVIAHRLSTIKNADQILLINDGQITNSGTHLELLTNSKLYENMWNLHIDAKNNSIISGGNNNV